MKSRTRIETIADGRSQRKIDRQTFIIHHYCPHTFNAGDHVVIRSIRDHLREYLPEAVFVPKASAHNRGWGRPVGLRGVNINSSNRYADAVLIGGSDHYNDWSLRIKGQEIVKLIPPLYLIGMGISSRDLQDPPAFSKKAYYQDALITHQQARLCAVRDHFTQRFLDQLGYTDAVVTGCPALYLYNKPFQLNESEFVALTFPFPVIRTGDRTGYNRLIEVMRYTLDLIKGHSLKPVIVTHDDRDVRAAQELFPEETLYFSNYVDNFCRFYEQVRIIIGSRLHASILAGGMGIPFININLDARGLGFSETFRLDHWNLNMNHDQLLTDLEERVRTVVTGDLSVFNDFFELKEEYRHSFRTFMKQVADDIRDSVAGS